LGVSNLWRKRFGTLLFYVWNHRDPDDESITIDIKSHREYDYLIFEILTIKISAYLVSGDESFQNEMCRLKES
jgi:hypothetical protein